MNVVLTPSADRSGVQLANYFLISSIGKGGFSQIYLAANEFHQPVSVKVLKASRTGDPEAVQSFLREIQITSQLKHPYIVPIIDHGKVGVTYYYVSPLVVSITLFELISIFKKVRKPPPLPLTLYLIEECLHILEFIHAQKVFKYSQSTLFHGDFTPDNILFTQDTTLRLIDFGNASHETEADGSRKLFGKLFYTPAEVLAGKTPKKSVDIYSLSVIFYELLYGEKPYVGKDKEELAKNIRKGQLSIPKLDETVVSNEKIQDFFKKALNASDFERFSTLQSWRTTFSKLGFKQSKCKNMEEVLCLLPSAVLQSLSEVQKKYRTDFEEFLKSPEAKRMTSSTQHHTPKTASKYELRQTPRIPVKDNHMIAQIEDPTSSVKFPAIISQLSSGGMLVRWNYENKQKGKTFHVKLQLGKGYHEISFEGMIIYALKIEDRIYVALSFKKINELNKRTLEHFILSRFREEAELLAFKPTPVMDIQIEDVELFRKTQKDNLMSRGLSLESPELFEDGTKLMIRLNFLPQFQTVTLHGQTLFRSDSEHGDNVYGIELHSTPFELARLKAILQKN